MDLLYVSLAAVGGGVLAGLLGWFSSGISFSARTFAPTVLRALMAGGAIALAYNYVGDVASITDIVVAFMAGAGMDVVGHRAAGSIISR